MYGPLKWLFPSFGTSFDAKCHSLVCALVVEGCRGDVHCHTYIRTIDRAKRKGTTSNPPLFRENPPLKVGKGEMAGSSPEVTKPYWFCLLGVSDIGLDVEELTVEASHAPKRMKIAGVGRRMVYISSGPKIFCNLARTHLVEEIRELLAASTEFLDLGMAKIEAEHLVPGFNSLVARLDKRHISSCDVLASPERLRR